ncbi:MAG: TIGR04076 family protein [Proteobacteria bacterium]|nr:TIGR04076 family protein [Pseudomonadota bacterium]MBU1451478.1 TIGR04076 family protein [Pseudomonadota bacterium]MBU2470487.1 TIGR04076 family protein [Pseudomonadota bacterium]MBU2516395.1 TIGR04076 family protein [Pseudomonadota bacterium]
MSKQGQRFRVKVKVVSVTRPCNAGHREGDEIIFEYNQVVGKICFDSMCSMIAKVHSLRYGAQFPWLKGPQAPALHSCPDQGNVTFELSRAVAGEGA